MSLPMISIIIPVYNTGATACKLIKRILDDEYTSIEIIVIDDGSTDDSLELLKKQKFEKVRIYNKKNGGPSSARNFGIDRAKGQKILFVDSDDDLEKGFITNIAKKCDDALIVTSVRFMMNGEKKEDAFLNDFPRKQNEDLETYILRSLLKDGRMYPVFNKIFRADIITNSKIRFDESMKFGEDTKFVLDYLRKTSDDIRFVPRVFYIHNLGTETSTAKKMEGEWKNWSRCYKNLKNWVGDRPSFYQKCLLAMIYLKWRYTWMKAR